MVWIWLRRRLRWARRATEARNLSRLSDGPDILALRALMNADYREIRGIDREPVDAWRRGDKKVMRELAQLELREAGVGCADAPLEGVGADDDLGRHRRDDGAVGGRRPDLLLEGVDRMPESKHHECPRPSARRAGVQR